MSENCEIYEIYRNNSCPFCRQQHLNESNVKSCHKKQLNGMNNMEDDIDSLKKEVEELKERIKQLS